MKVLILDDKLWELVRTKIKAELHCTETAASFCLGTRRRTGQRHWNEARLRKRHIEAIKLARILNQ